MTDRILTLLILLLMPALCAAQSDSVYYGVASYYHNKFQGRKTSNGEIFRNDSLTAAHKRLPFGTRVRVTNLSNDSTVIVRINDRLPQSSKRSIDLSQAAARKLNMMKAGIVKARIEILPPERIDSLIIASRGSDSIQPLIDTTIIHDSVWRVLNGGRKGYPEGITRHEPTRKGNCIIERVMVVRSGLFTAYVKTTCAGEPVIYTRSGSLITGEEFKKETGFE